MLKTEWKTSGKNNKECVKQREDTVQHLHASTNDIFSVSTMKLLATVTWQMKNLLVLLSMTCNI